MEVVGGLYLTKIIVCSLLHYVECQVFLRMSCDLTHGHMTCYVVGPMGGSGAWKLLTGVSYGILGKANFENFFKDGRACGPFETRVTA